ncbi:MAG: hypothetical protein AMXMBFR64_38350 [Myxococcales bacterium]
MRVMILVAWLLGGCEAAETAPGGDTSATAGATGTVTLGIDGGVVFGTGTAMAKGHDLKADLMAYKSGTGLDLKAGIPQGSTSRRPLHVLKTPGGTDATFASLAEVPVELPSESEANAYAHKVKAGMGIVLRNNVSEGHTVVWVEAAGGSPATVTLQYRVILE